MQTAFMVVSVMNVHIRDVRIYSNTQRSVKRNRLRCTKMKIKDNTAPLATHRRLWFGKKKCETSL